MVVKCNLQGILRMERLGSFDVVEKHFAKAEEWTRKYKNADSSIPQTITMPAKEAFKRFVEVGRVVIVNEGESAGKLAVIVEIIDHNKAIIDGPSTGVPRQAFRYRYMSLTPLVVSKLPRAAGTSTVKKYFEQEGIAEKWASTTWAKKRQAHKLKREMSDFDRFNVMLLKKERRRIIGTAAKKVSA